MGSKFDFKKHQGEANYSIWSQRAEAFLIKEGYINTLEDIVTSDVIDGNTVLIPILPASQPRRIADNKGLAYLKLIVKNRPLNQIKAAKCLGKA